MVQRRALPLLISIKRVPANEEIRSRAWLEARNPLSHKRIGLRADKELRSPNDMASARTIKDLRTVLRSALSTAISDELIDKNVAALVKVPRLRPRKVVAWSSDEARRFLESARADDDPLYAAYVLVLGLRKGEVMGLTWPTGPTGHHRAARRQTRRVTTERCIRPTVVAALSVV
jgi:integrase